MDIDAVNARVDEQASLNFLAEMVRFKSYSSTDGETALARFMVEAMRDIGLDAEAQWVEAERYNAIGRLPGENDVVLEDSDASRNHLRFSRRVSGYHVEDLGTSNGSLLNGERLAEPHVLANKDIVKVGEVQITFLQTRKNPRTQTDKLSLRKYDPVARKHVEFKEAKIK